MFKATYTVFLNKKYDYISVFNLSVSGIKLNLFTSAVTNVLFELELLILFFFNIGFIVTSVSVAYVHNSDCD